MAFKVLKTIPMGKGATMEIKIDESEPEDSINRYASDVVSTGEAAFEVPPHWHKYHSEHMLVLEGRVMLTCNGETIELKAGDPAFLIPRRAVHSIRSFKGERLRIRETPDPPGMYKALFFNDLLANGDLASGGFLRTMRVFWDGDAYPALPLYFQFIDEMFLFFFGGIARLFVAKRAEEL